MSCSLKRCENCPFIGKLVGSRGPEDSPFVWIGESPGRQEAKEGLPFIGPSWEVIQKSLDYLGVGDFPEPYITNAFKCWPGHNKEAKILPEAAAACHASIEEELGRYPRKVILAMGNPALWTVTNNFGLRITQERGKVFQTMLAEVGAVAAVHPAYLMRNQGSLRQFKADLNYAVDLINGKPIRMPGRATYEILHSEEDVNRFCSVLKVSGSRFVSADAETTGFNFLSDRLLCIGFSFIGDHAYIIPDYNISASQKVFQVCRDNGIQVVWHNGKFDVKFFHTVDIPEAFVDEDTMLESYSLDEIGGIHDLETVSSDWCGSPNWKNELKQFIPKHVTENGITRKGNYGDVPREKLWWYLAQDLKNTFDIHKILRPKIQRDVLTNIQYTKTLIPASEFLAEVEKNGIFVDLQRVNRLSKRMDNKARWQERKLNRLAQKHAGHSINPRSPKQLAVFLFDELVLPHKIRSTNIKVLDSLPDHPFVMGLKAYRKLFKAYSTNVKSVRQHIKVDGRVHSTYLLHGTRTGRLASREPNLQNVPRDPSVRGQFIAPEGRLFFETDLNQAELRSLADLSGDPEMIRIYTTEGMSIHEEMRASIWGQPEEWEGKDLDELLIKFYLTPYNRYDEKGNDRLVGEQKMRAKAVNFGIVYGREAPSIAEEFNISVQEAQSWINAWFKRFPQAHDFILRCRAAPTAGKTIATCFGYKKRFGVVTRETLKTLQNEAANMPHQSIASTICLHGGMATYKRLKEEFDVLVLNPVHDSLLNEAPEKKDIIVRAAELVENTMQAVPREWGFEKVPFLAETKVGKRWGSLVDRHKWVKTYEGP